MFKAVVQVIIITLMIINAMSVIATAVNVLDHFKLNVVPVKILIFIILPIIPAQVNALQLNSWMLI